MFTVIITTIICAIIGGVVGFCLQLISCVTLSFCVPFDGIKMWHLTVPCAIIGGIIGFLIGIYTKKEEEEAEMEKHVKWIRDTEQEELDSAFTRWKEKLFSCYPAIENNVRLNNLFEPGDLYEPIWELEKVQPELRYKTTFNQKLSKHIEWLRERIDYNLQNGYYAVSMCVTAARCLKKAYHEDPCFDLAIETLIKLYDRAQSDTFYIEFLQYGDCKLSITSMLNQADLDARIAALKSRLQEIDTAFQAKDDYYRNILPDMANYIDYAAELVWCIAAKKPFNQNEFDEARKLFARHTRKCWADGKPYVITMYEKAYRNRKKEQKFLQIEHVEQLLALIYAKNLIGGQNTVNQERKNIFEWVNAAIAYGMKDQCYLLSSALSWMGLYELERDVLRYLVEQKVILSEELQDRLGFLESGGTSTIKIYDVGASEEFLYDNSALEWNAAAFDIFFRKLDMTHKGLNYSLAISKWTKTLTLAQGQKITQEQIGQEFMQLVEDYDGEILVQRSRAKALNLVNVEYESAFIFKFTSERNRCISILFSCEKYGRNLNTTIIIMFTPESGLVSEELRKYALAIKDNIYVESFKKSIIQTVDEVIKPEETIYGDEQSDNGNGVFE